MRTTAFPRFLAPGLLLAFFAGCTGGEGGGGGGGEDRDPRFDALAAQVELEREALGAPGVSVALLEDGEVVWAEGFGSRLADGDKRAKATTLYRIGSCNKMLTSAALLRKVDAGTVQLDDAVTVSSPDFHFDEDPSWADTIEVQHLLSHTSGMYDYLAIDGPTADSALESFLTGTSASSFGGFMFLMSPSGRFWNYSNPNFYVAALVDEKTSSGVYYRDLLTQGVLEPLGMDRTLFLAEDVLDDGDYATGLAYDWVNGTSATRIADPEAYDNAWARPAGYAWSSVLDMAAFATFLLDGNTAVLSDALREEMQSPLVNTEYFLEYGFYGYGLSVNEGFQLGNDWYETRLVSHDGAIPGFSASMYVLPESRFAFVVLANTDGAYFPDSLAMALRDFGSLPAPVTPPDPQIDPTDFASFAGTYQDPYNVGEIGIAASNGEVTITMPDLDDLGIPYDTDLVPYSKNNFVLGIQGTQVLATFILDSGGNAEYFRTRFAVGAREAPAFAPSAAPAIDGERLRRALQSAKYDAPPPGRY